MPTLDKERGVLIVRVVYDGPPHSGKTTTLRSLAKGLGVEIHSPEERDGRTLFFDWVEYVGGLFEGRQIRCQIVSVPGQAELAERRRLLLESADAIVLVADTRAPAIDSAFEHLRGLLPWCRTQDPPVGIVLQANKRDTSDSVPRTRIFDEVSNIAPIAIVDTVATTGDGIREAFVFGVRLALDRVRSLAARGALTQGPPDVDTPEQLFDQMQSSLVESKGEAPSAVTQEDGERKFVPDPMMPGGFIWPPVDGRTLLHEVARLPLEPVRTTSGDWWASGAGWRFHSAASAVFADADLGRQGLIEWARLHATNLHRISAGRTVILADAGGGYFRLWQLVRVAPTLRERLAASAVEAEAEALASDLADAARHVLRARRDFHEAGICLPCTLWTISADLGRQPTFVGLMPTPANGGPVEEADGIDLVERELGPFFRYLENERDDYERVVVALKRPQWKIPDAVAESLTRLACG